MAEQMKQTAASSLAERYFAAKHHLFDTLYQSMNEKQREAVYTVNGPLLVLAGAGTGKTTVLVNRIAHIIRYGNAYYDDTVPNGLTEANVSALEQSASVMSGEELGQLCESFSSNPCPPWAILTITFTNKAANEMKERLSKVIGEKSADIWASAPLFSAFPRRSPSVSRTLTTERRFLNTVFSSRKSRS